MRSEHNWSGSTSTWVQVQLEYIFLGTWSTQVHCFILLVLTCTPLNVSKILCTRTCVHPQQYSWFHFKSWNYLYSHRYWLMMPNKKGAAFEYFTIFAINSYTVHASVSTIVWCLILNIFFFEFSILCNTGMIIDNTHTCVYYLWVWYICT